jgi:hypothetical protein
VNRAEDGSRLEGEHPRSKLAPFHALDLGAEVNRCKYLDRDTPDPRCCLLVAHGVSVWPTVGAGRAVSRP